MGNSCRPRLLLAAAPSPPPRPSASPSAAGERGGGGSKWAKKGSETGGENTTHDWGEAQQAVALYHRFVSTLPCCETRKRLRLLLPLRLRLFAPLPRLAAPAEEQLLLLCRRRDSGLRMLLLIKAELQSGSSCAVPWALGG